MAEPCAEEDCNASEVVAVFTGVDECAVTLYSGVAATGEAIFSQSCQADSVLHEFVTDRLPVANLG